MDLFVHRALSGVFQAGAAWVVAVAEDLSVFMCVRRSSCVFGKIYVRHVPWCRKLEASISRERAAFLSAPRSESFVNAAKNL